MSHVRVFDPPMCCSSGVCGTDPDVTLARFSADLHWLQTQGVVVERFTLSQQPEKFTAEPLVMRSINDGGTDALPVVMIGTEVVAERRYPSREQLAALLGLVSPVAPAVSKSGEGCCTPGTCC